MPLNIVIDSDEDVVLASYSKEIASPDSIVVFPKKVQDLL